MRADHDFLSAFILPAAVLVRCRQYKWWAQPVSNRRILCFKQVLCLLSYESMAGTPGFEPVQTIPQTAALSITPCAIEMVEQRGSNPYYWPMGQGLAV